MSEQFDLTIQSADGECWERLTINPFSNGAIEISIKNNNFCSSNNFNGDDVNLELSQDNARLLRDYLNSLNLD